MNRKKKIENELCCTGRTVMQANLLDEIVSSLFVVPPFFDDSKTYSKASNWIVSPSSNTREETTPTTQSESDADSSDSNRGVVVVNDVFGKDIYYPNPKNVYPHDRRCYPNNKADFVCIRRNIMRIVILDSLLENQIALSDSGRFLLRYICEMVLRSEKPKRLNHLASHNISRLSYYLYRNCLHKRRQYRRLRLRFRKANEDNMEEQCSRAR